MAETTRIFSDLHFLEGSSRIHALPQLRPLFDGVNSVILNGDCLDTQNADPDGRVTAEIKAYFPSLVRHCTFITGNHDPDISDTHEVLLAGGQVWVTHGDTLFEDMVPWSRYHPEIMRRLAIAQADIPRAERNRFETRMRVFRQICLRLPREHDPRDKSARYKILRYWHVAFPLRCSLGLIRSWLSTPGRAAALAAAHQPGARFIINGHTHFPGVWRRHDGRVVINTGSFCPPLDGTLVDLQDGRLTVRSIECRGGEFCPGKTIAEFPLAAGAVSSISARATL